jgi:hypothetical protein
VSALRYFSQLPSTVLHDDSAAKALVTTKTQAARERNRIQTREASKGPRHEERDLDHSLQQSVARVVTADNHVEK